MNTKSLFTLAAITVVAALAGITFNVLAPALFLAAVCAFVVLIAATDYSAAPRRSFTIGARNPERLPLAG